MKKIFTLIALACFALPMMGQEETPLYTATGEVLPYPEDWGSPYDPALCFFTDVKECGIEAYDGYTIVRGWAGVEGYDICVVHDSGELEWASIQSIYNIIDGEEKDENVKSGYYYVQTGREDYPTAAVTLSYSDWDYSFISTYPEDKEGQLILTGVYFYDANGQYTYGDYYMEWPKESEDGITGVSIDRQTDGAAYNILGVKVGDDYKGLVIKNGKKCIRR